jgi:RNA polymerase sigma-70 factor, ECF subfamily
VTEGRGATARGATASFAALCADEGMFTTWYEQALPRVYGFTLARTAGDAALAEDVTAQAFMEAIRARASFDGRSDPVTWICSIARNRLLDHYRRTARDQARHLRLIMGGDLSDEPAAWDRHERRDIVLSALATLSPLARSAVTLHYLDGYSVRETAHLIGRSEAATESLLSRSREQLRAAFPGGLE